MLALHHHRQWTLRSWFSTDTNAGNWIDEKHARFHTGYPCTHDNKRTRLGGSTLFRFSGMAFSRTPMSNNVLGDAAHHKRSGTGSFSVCCTASMQCSGSITRQGFQHQRWIHLQASSANTASLRDSCCRREHSHPVWKAAGDVSISRAIRQRTSKNHQKQVDFPRRFAGFLTTWAACYVTHLELLLAYFSANAASGVENGEQVWGGNTGWRRSAVYSKGITGLGGSEAGALEGAGGAWLNAWFVGSVGLLGDGVSCGPLSASQ